MSDEATAQPQRLGKYELIRSIARGGMGQVHLAKLAGELGFEKLLVVKTVRPELAADPRFVELFAAEARTAVGLSHPNIAPIYELGRAEDGTLYTAMGWVDGPSLQALIAARRARAQTLPLGAVLFIARELLDGLAYAHAGDGQRPAIVHRDINPRNVLVERSGRVQIIDFGIAKPAESETASGAGSVGYMAPEQARGEHVDPRADVFSVGCVIYELCTGARAFDEAGVWVSPDLDRVPAALRAFVERCLALDPAARYPDGEACLRAVGPLLGRHAPGFASRDLATLVAATFPAGWTSSSATGTGPDEVTPATAAPLEAFATRLPDTAAPASEAPSAADAPAPAPAPPTDDPAPTATREARGPLAYLGLVAILGLLVVLVVRPWASPGGRDEPDPPPDPTPTPAAGGETGEDAAPERPRPGTGETGETAAPAPLAITLQIDPPGATVELDGAALDGPPFVIELAPDGPARELEFALAGHRGQTLTLDPAAPPPDAALAITLEPLADGQLSVLAPSVAWAEVWLDGERIGTTPLTKRAVVEGRHQLEVRCTAAVCERAQVLVERSVKIRPGRLSTITVE